MFSHLDFKEITGIAKHYLLNAVEDHGDSNDQEWQKYATKERAQAYVEAFNAASEEVEAYAAPAYGGFLVWIRRK